MSVKKYSVPFYKKLLERYISYRYGHNLINTVYFSYSVPKLLKSQTLQIKKNKKMKKMKIILGCIIF